MDGPTGKSGGTARWVPLAGRGELLEWSEGRGKALMADTLPTPRPVAQRRVHQPTTRA